MQSKTVNCDFTEVSCLSSVQEPQITDKLARRENSPFLTCGEIQNEIIFSHVFDLLKVQQTQFKKIADTSTPSY